MNAYSNDLRRRIVESYEGGEHTLAEVADLFGVSLATVKNFLRRQRETGSPDALPHAGGRRPALFEKACRFVREALRRDNDLTLDELRRRPQARHRQTVSRPTLCRLLQALGLPRKKSRSTSASATRRESGGRAAAARPEALQVRRRVGREPRFGAALRPRPARRAGGGQRTAELRREPDADRRARARRAGRADDDPGAATARLFAINLVMLLLLFLLF
jgi:transposase